MLFYDFKDYEGFKEIFGIIEHGNGVKSRKNKILLALYKDKYAFKWHILSKEHDSIREQFARAADRIDRIDYRLRSNLPSSDVHKHKMLSIKLNLCQRYENIPKECRVTLLTGTLPVLKSRLLEILGDRDNHSSGWPNSLYLMGYRFYSSLYATDDMNGICEDGTLNSIRYRNIEKDRVYKMKAGKMFNHIMSENLITRRLPEQIKRWLSEEFVGEWILHTTEFFSDGKYQLYVGGEAADFKLIYSQSGFGSCMTNNGNYTFYTDAVDAKAAWITNEFGSVLARCVIYNDVKDEDDRKWRLAERQYSKNSDLSLQRILVCKLIRGGYIDGYKKVGASCHDARAFLDNKGNSLEDKEFYIDCRLHPGDRVSYQDSFKWYDEDTETATNYGDGCDDLATTDGVYRNEDCHENDCFSNYYNEWIPEDDACYVETRDDYFYYDDVVEGYRQTCSGSFISEYLHENDVIEVSGDYYYAGDKCVNPERYGLCRCPHCNDWFVPGREESCYSDVTEEDYCCYDCREEAERIWYNDNGFEQSDWDDEWYLEEEIIVAKEWYYNRWWETKIYIGKFNDLVEEGKATGYLGEYYIDKVNSEGEPVHFERISVAV